MRLNVKHKQSLTKTDKQKKANAEKKSKGPKISKNYMDTSEFKNDNVDIDLTLLTYGMIDSCTVDALILPDGVIHVKNSWLEILLIMLDNLITNYPNDFERILGENQVTSQFFVVDKVYGKYTFELEQYKAYKIFNSGYYLEAIFNSANIFQAIVGLTKSLNIPLNEMKFHLRNKKYKDIELNFDMLEETESIVDITGVSDMLKSGIHMVAIEILGVSTRVHRMDVALVVLCNWISQNYGDNGLKSLKNNNGTGICNEVKSQELLTTPINNSNLYIYSDGDSNNIIKFIEDSLDKLNIGKDKIRFKFRALKAKSELKEWEVE